MPLPAVGVRNIEDIAQLVVARTIHQKGDALAASVDPPPELVPHAHLRTGGGIRPLGVDEELIPEAVFMIPGGGGEEVHVGLAAGADAQGFCQGQLQNFLFLTGHFSFLLSSFLLSFRSGEAPAVYLADGIAQPSGIAVNVGFSHRSFVDLIL